ncbi:RNA 2',3'-cyclic phosphodiesterase [Fredinandcohnia sp. QZ13]|uniref:RNA 2',3'-cyclic phosphodiesterase n=1 Tax=Fredinandcohnia sp. QZ13 TaxID=3073144 RepID=UPI002852FFD0|nr:RNA 2',3'-cyclic phosphodiesterase [Fredinandcohnia sp. QZ13]MDR4889288.1 RNA 2',3'-cyclic phosphodiesterase [Fredinandcohnia sp. QZ13]
MEQQTHYFLALALPAETKELLHKWREMLEPRLKFKSWVHPEDLHITLAFLGGQASFKQLTDIKKKMPEIAKKHERFTLQINEMGTFGKSDSPRILWAGVEENEKLRALRRDVYGACTDLGFSLDKRSFTPHITMARRWKSESPFLPTQLKDIVQPKEEKSIFEAGHFVLYQTHLNRSPKYQPLSIFSLK